VDLGSTGFRSGLFLGLRVGVLYMKTRGMYNSFSLVALIARFNPSQPLELEWLMYFSGSRDSYRRMDLGRRGGYKRAVMPYGSLEKGVKGMSKREKQRDARPRQIICTMVRGSCL
jgi:hypothetical protein